MYHIEPEFIEQYHLKHHVSLMPSTHHLLMAHGAGASTSHPFFAQLIPLLNQNGCHVWTFDFAYMVKALSEEKKRPPAQLPLLIKEYESVIGVVRQLIGTASLWIGGKSMGARVACHVANQDNVAHDIEGVYALGYPFHPVGKPDKLRLEVLQATSTPIFICQGERDAFGNVNDISHYSLPEHIKVAFIHDGDHSFIPRKSSGRDIMQNLKEVADLLSTFVHR